MVYILGNKASDLGTEVEVKLDYGKIWDIASYDPEYNAFKVNGQHMTQSDVGTWKILVKVSYKDLKGQI